MVILVEVEVPKDEFDIEEKYRDRSQIMSDFIREKARDFTSSISPKARLKNISIGVTILKSK